MSNEPLTDLSSQEEYPSATAQGLYHWKRLGLGETVSQYGDYRGFRDAPRFEDAPGTQVEYDISVTRGRRTVEEVYRAMTGRPPKPHLQPKVRYFQVLKLMIAGYATLSTPRQGNPDHASICGTVEHPLESPEYRQWWDSPARKPLDGIAEP